MEQPRRYLIEDLVADVTFQQYCMGRDMNSVQYWDSYFKSNLEQRAAGEKAKKLYLMLSGNHTAKQYSKHFELFKAKVAILSQPDQPALKIKLFHSGMWLAAACIAIVFTAAVLLFQDYFSISTGTGKAFFSKAGEKKTIKLNDGTVVILNGATTLVLDKYFNSKNRRLVLDGEAYFEVKHNDKVPFMVQTKSLLITDLGTKFNVKAFPADGFTETALIEGLIEVAAVNKPTKKILLKPNQKITFINLPKAGSAATGAGATDIKFSITPLSKNMAANTIVETDWVQNRLTFNDDDFSEIAAKLERWYGIGIEFEKEGIKTYKYVGTFENKNIYEVLDVLKMSRDFNYRKEGSRIIIY